MSLTAPTLAEDGSSQLAEGSGLTLLRLGLWTEEMRLKMKMMVEVVEDVKSEFLLTMRNRRRCLISSELWWSFGIESTRSYESW